jgi:predicted polyphosphate/ATP-dependent NAD kinase
MAEGWRRVGLIVNPIAGSGFNESLRAARTVIQRCGAEEVCTGRGQTGETALSGCRSRVQIHDVGPAVGSQQTRALARWIAGQKLDALVVVGGDGTISDAAIEVGSSVPVVGIGTGSTNVGRLITCPASRVEELDFRDLETWKVDALLASVNDELVGMAFNDVVIGTTIVGMIDVQRCDMSAAERKLGNMAVAKPRPVGNRETKVTRVSAGEHTLVATGESIGTVVAGFAEPAFFGKAIAGGICLATLTGLPAGCLVCDLPLAQVGITAQTLLSAPPAVCRYVSLSEETTIVVENMEGDATVCVDGNPVHRLTMSDRVTISVRTGAALGVRSNKDLRSA